MRKKNHENEMQTRTPNRKDKSKANKPRVPNQIAEAAVGQQVHIVLLVLTISNSLQPGFLLTPSKTTALFDT